MNANELADKLEDDYWDSRANKVMLESAKMLIQQQDRIGVLEANHKIQLDINEKALQYIADLEKGLDSSLNLNKAQAERHGNNEPVAWLLFRDGGESYPEYTTSYKQMREWETYLGDNERIEPHYIHPAKTLTDEEIEGIAKANVDGHSSMEQLKWFARAILKKASEK